MKFKLSDKKLKIIVVFGLIGIALIFVSTLFNGNTSEKDKEGDPIQETVMENDVYQQKIEKQVGDIVKSIAGVGETRIMVTLQNGVEYVYVTEENVNLDKTNSKDDTLAEKRSTQEKTIFVEDSDGKRKALLQKVIEPTIKGVVIVCEGGDDVLVKERVTDAVKTALNISSSRVCVTKLS